MKEAIKPDFFFKNLPSIQQADNEAEKKGANEEERAIFAMSQSKGWLILKETITGLYKDLNEVNKTAIQAGASLAEIGQNTVVVSLTQDLIDKILNKVSDAVEACTQDEQ